MIRSPNETVRYYFPMIDRSNGKTRGERSSVSLLLETNARELIDQLAYHARCCGVEERLTPTNLMRTTSNVEASVRLCWPNLAAKHGEEGGVGFD